MISQTCGQLTEFGLQQVSNIVDSERRMRTPRKLGERSAATADVETPDASASSSSNGSPKGGPTPKKSTKVDSTDGSDKSANADRTEPKKKLKIWLRPPFAGIPEVRAWGKLSTTDRSKDRFVNNTISIACGFRSRCRFLDIPDRTSGRIIKDYFKRPEFLRNGFCHGVPDWSNWPNWNVGDLVREIDNFVGLTANDLPEFLLFLQDVSNDPSWTASDSSEPSKDDDDDISKTFKGFKSKDDAGGDATTTKVEEAQNSGSVDPDGEQPKKRSRIEAGGEPNVPKQKGKKAQNVPPKPPVKSYLSAASANLSTIVEEPESTGDSKMGNPVVDGSRKNRGHESSFGKELRDHRHKKKKRKRHKKRRKTSSPKSEPTGQKNRRNSTRPDSKSDLRPHHSTSASAARGLKDQTPRGASSAAGDSGTSTHNNGRGGRS